MDDFILPEGMMKQEKMFAMPVYPIAKALYDLQKNGIENLEDYVIVVPTDKNSQYQKFYIVHKSTVR